MSHGEGDDRLVADALRAPLGECTIGRQIFVVEETTSTNDLVWSMAAEGAGVGLVIFAERQTAGRGQYGRRWESAPHKGLWFSVLLRPKLTLEESPQLSGVLAGLIAETITDQLNCAATVKPPNDIYVEGRKVAGVLVEGRTDVDGNYIAVAGIGVNVNQAIEDFPEELRASAGSLALAMGNQLSREELAVAFLKKLERALL